MKPDSQLQRDVLDELMFEPSVNHSQIGSEARDGVELRIAGEKKGQDRGEGRTLCGVGVQLRNL